MFVHLRRLWVLFRAWAWLGSALLGDVPLAVFI